MLFTCLFIKKIHFVPVSMYSFKHTTKSKYTSCIIGYFTLLWHIQCRRGSRGGRISPLPWNFQNIHIREHHFRRYQGVFLHSNFKNFRLASLACYHIYLCQFHHYRSTIFQIALDISRSCIVHILSTSVESYNVPNPRHIFQYTSEKVSKYRCSLQGFFKIVNFLIF